MIFGGGGGELSNSKKKFCTAKTATCNGSHGEKIEHVRSSVWLLNYMWFSKKAKKVLAHALNREILHQAKHRTTNQTLFSQPITEPGAIVPDLHIFPRCLLIGSVPVYVCRDWPCLVLATLPNVARKQKGWLKGKRRSLYELRKQKDKFRYLLEAKIMIFFWPSTVMTRE